MDIDKIGKSGFKVKQDSYHSDSIAFLSLRISLDAYFKTYKSVASYIIIFEGSQLTQEEIDKYYTPDYIENACESIFHFQHFIELILKEILRNKHPLLSIDASKKSELLYNLLFNESYDEHSYESVNQLEFSESLNRIVELIKKDKIDKNKYGFIVKAKKILEVINSLRNRIAHGGMFVIRYQALDSLFGEYLFPFIEKVFELEEYKNKRNNKFKSNDVNIDPINEIINHFKVEEYSILKVALLKEIGRASLENPMFLSGFSILDSYNDATRRRSEIFANEVYKLEHLDEVVKCPICGTTSLVKYQDFYDETDEISGETLDSYQYIFGVKCHCCSFEIDNKISNIENMNLNIENYWIAK